MKKVLLILSIFFLCLSSSFGIKDERKKTILWVKWKLVPEYIEAGHFKNQGYLDKFLEYAQKRMPEYNHVSEYMPLKRIEQSWQRGNVCSLHLWLGYWPDKIQYSTPYGFTPRYGIIVKKDSPIDQELKPKESVSLKYLLNKTNYRLGILPLFYSKGDDSRYPLLKDLIAPHLSSKRVMEIRNSRNEISVEYLKSNRVDYIIRQRITHFSEMKIDSKDANAYSFYRLNEAYQYKLVASACSDSSFGREVIGKINNFIARDQDFFKQYLGLRQEWDVDNLVFEKVYNEYFLEHKANSNITE